MDIKSELRKIKLPSAKWTLQTFLDSARLIHGDQYDYSNISEDDISNNQSRISIFCKQCKNVSTPVISNHLRGKKCHVCWENEKRWTLDKFLISACKIHGDKFDYSNISKEDILNSKSYVNISCKMCGYNWKVQIHGHIVLKSSCPSCTNHIPWTLKRFTDKSMLVHGKDKWDYSLITKDDILKSDERVYLICKTCKNISNPFVTSHIQGGGCGFCFRQRKNWTLKKFLTEAREIHGDKYDYSNMKEKDANHSRCKLKIKCNKCQNMFFPLLMQHITQMTGCPICASSKGETFCAEALTIIGVEFIREFRLKNSRRFYDFHFIHDSKKYLLEFDGIQHFKYNKFFHRSSGDFYEKQKIDILKTQNALQNGFFVIRIDFTQLRNIKYHINQAFTMSKITNLYVSNEKKYDYILKVVNTWKKYLRDENGYVVVEFIE